MKKRLHYAMPRIPLQKLKANKNGQCEDQNVQDEPKSHVGTIAKAIRNAKIGKGQVSDRNITEQDFMGTDKNVNNQNVDKIRRKHPEHNKGKKLLKIMKISVKMDHIGDFGLTKMEKRQLKQITSRLEKLHRDMQEGSTTTESDTSNTTLTASCQSSLQSEAEECMNSVAISKKTTDKLFEADDKLDVPTTAAEDCDEEQFEGAMGGVFYEVEDSSCESDAEKNFEVIADVHCGRGDDQIEGAVGAVVKESMTETISRDPIVDEETRIHHASMAGYQIDSDSSIEFDHHKQSKKWKRWRMGKHKENNLKLGKIRKDTIPQGTGENQTKFQWGQEEESSGSSSDGGWDFETGGMPLLPR